MLTGKPIKSQGQSCAKTIVVLFLLANKKEGRYNITKWGMNSGTSGVYMLKNKLNGMAYVGSSCDIPMRLGTHFTRDYKLYPDKPLYKDIAKYGETGFEVILLCECAREDLIEKEQLYYDLLKPQYNFIRLRKCNFTHPEVRANALKKWNYKRGYREKKTII